MEERYDRTDLRRTALRHRSASLAPSVNPALYRLHGGTGATAEMIGGRQPAVDAGMTM